MVGGGDSGRDCRLAKNHSTIRTRILRGSAVVLDGYCFSPGADHRPTPGLLFDEYVERVRNFCRDFMGSISAPTTASWRGFVWINRDHRGIARPFPTSPGAKYAKRRQQLDRMGCVTNIAPVGLEHFAADDYDDCNLAYSRIDHRGLFRGEKSTATLAECFGRGNAADFAVARRREGSDCSPLSVGRRRTLTA